MPLEKGLVHFETNLKGLIRHLEMAKDLIQEIQQSINSRPRPRSFTKDVFVHKTVDDGKNL